MRFCSSLQQHFLLAGCDPFVVYKCVTPSQQVGEHEYLTHLLHMKKLHVHITNVTNVQL